MSEKIVTMQEARETINHLVQGVDPYSGEVLENVTFLHDPRMIRCFAVMSDVLTQCIEGKNATYAKAPFVLTDAMIEEVQFPDGEYGVMKLINAINAQIDTQRMKRLSAFAFNKKLIEEGMLSYAEDEGSKKAVVNKASQKIGIKSVKALFNNEEYDKVIYTDKAKDYVKDNLKKWFGA